MGNTDTLLDKDLIFKADLIIVNGKVLKDRGNYTYAKVQSEEEIAYGGTTPPIPEGYERIDFRFAKSGELYLDGVSQKEETAIRDHKKTGIGERIILRAKKKRYAVAKVELPKGFHINTQSCLHGEKNITGHLAVRCFHWEIVEE